MENGDLVDDIRVWAENFGCAAEEQEFCCMKRSAEDFAKDSFDASRYV